MTAFEIYPAIDLRRGQVVRLAQGDPSRQTTYPQLAAEAAQRWVQAGAGWLHVVNLDGAFEDPDSPSRAALREILTAVRHSPAGCRVQYGGGLRSLDAVEAALEAGIHRVVLGTAAVKNPDLISTCLARFGPRHLAVGIDAYRGLVAVRGWQEASSLTPASLAGRMEALGMQTVIYTDISLDGMGGGSDPQPAAELARQNGLEVILAGGVSRLEDIRAAREAGLSGVVIGRALYEGQIDLKEALSC